MAKIIVVDVASYNSYVAAVNRARGNTREVERLNEAQALHQAEAARLAQGGQPRSVTNQSSGDYLADLAARHRQ